MRFFLILSLAVLSLFCQPVQAQEQGGVVGEEEILVSFIRKPTGPEDIKMTYYKLGKIQPNLKAWAETAHVVEEAPEYDRDVVTLAEFNRLQNKFSNFKIDNVIYIQGKVDLSQYSTIKETLFLEEITPTSYFPYKTGDRTIAVMIQDIGQFSKLSISKAEMDEIYKEVGEEKKATVEMAVMPLIAKTDSPIVIGQQQNWPILGKMAEFIIWSGNDMNARPLWSWRAEGYTPKHEDKGLNELFKKR